MNTTVAAASSPRALSRPVVGVAYGVAAFLWWGLVPLYFKAVAHVSPWEVLAHRIIWSVLLLSVLMRVYRRWRVALEALKLRRTRITLLGSTCLIALNWFVFIWAVSHDLVLQASLGYFINPLVNVLLGFVFLHERLRRWQWVSVALAATGVSYLTWMVGTLPAIALVLAGSFGFYGLLRKTAHVDSLVGLTLETLLLLPVAIAYLVYLVVQHESTFGAVSRGTDLLLMAAGVVTAVPLLWFANAARRLQLSTIAFLQYIAPSFQFLLAVTVFGETFTRDHLIAFLCIWTALAIYSTDTALRSRRRAPATPA